ncbi:hypothetical protein Q5424_01210 [Conexibacter sp. JD483]|uniref:hypothetical protein n=1 Tax=unclassified Conexibacter TaxID=2627773 RepID=UPI00271A20FF|nr:MULTISPECIES: hypothetical protein [unclassified Conexibacter]MDO8185847.1 hypothetical protein [Conexibacter sp. CPCC 205706]MDO8198591.1 hypothetical protein [Conexibacter sp. CPCC 205762]MDR9367677.1 hypothetical protein [Conexibacter sp. JD483]
MAAVPTITPTADPATRSFEPAAGDLRAHELLPVRVRSRSGRVFEGQLPAWRHRRIHLGYLHADTAGLFEIAHGYRPSDGRTRWSSRHRDDSYWLGGATNSPDWLEDALTHISGLCARPRREVAIGPAVRSEPRPTKAAVSESRWLWLDIDDPAILPRLSAFLLQRPAHLRIASGGSGGEHAYWRLAAPQPSFELDAETGAEVEWIERAHARLVEHIGLRVEVDGHEVLRGADPKCKDRSRIMRLPGTVNYKTGEQARLLAADFALASYSLQQLVGHLPDRHLPASPTPPRPLPPRRASAAAAGRVSRSRVDGFRQIPAIEYAARMTGQRPDGSGLIRCPALHHEDNHPSCSVAGPNPTLFCCHGCETKGTIFDFASALLGGPIGSDLRDEAFRRAYVYVDQHFGNPDRKETRCPTAFHAKPPGAETRRATAAA